MFESLNIIPYLKQSKPVRNKSQNYDFWRKKPKLFHLDREKLGNSNNNGLDPFYYQYEYRSNDWNGNYDELVLEDEPYLDNVTHTNESIDHSFEFDFTSKYDKSNRINSQDDDFQSYQQLYDENLEFSPGFQDIYEGSKMNTGDSNITRFDIKFDQSDFDVKKQFVYEKHWKNGKAKVFDLNNFYDCGIHFINKD